MEVPMRELTDVEQQLRASWSIETASTWTRENPARGQCSVTALVVQDLLGGLILKTRVGPQWHFYNSIDGKRVDLTASQFESLILYDDVPATRGEAFEDTSPEQYRALRRRLSLEV
jgi:hypothetical protein